MKIAISRSDHENCSVIVMSLRAPLHNAGGDGLLIMPIVIDLALGVV